MRARVVGDVHRIVISTRWMASPSTTLAFAALTPADGLPGELLDFSIDSDGATGAAKDVEPETTDEEPAD